MIGAKWRSGLSSPISMDLTCAVQVRTQLMTMMSVLEKSLVTIHPDRNKIENAELRQRIVDAYHQSKVS